MGIRRESLDELLTRAGAEPAKLAEARTQAERAGISLLGGITRTNAVDDAMLAKSLGDLTGIEVVGPVAVEEVNIDLIREVPLGLAREQGILPLWEKDGVIHVALSSPTSLSSIDDFRVLFGRPVRAGIMGPVALRELTNAAYDAASRTASAVIDEIEEEEGYVADDLWPLPTYQEMLFIK